MILIFSILLYPIFFILLYATAEYIFPTKNGAMIFSLCAAFLLSYAYYTIRKKVSQHQQKKAKITLDKEMLRHKLMLLQEKNFDKFFEGEHILSDNSFSGLKEEKLLQALRQYGPDTPLEIYSLNGLTQGCRDLASLLGAKLTEHSREEIFDKVDLSILPEITPAVPGTKFSRLKAGIFSESFRKFAIKYGVILLLISIITPYKTYYIITGLLLTGFGLLLWLRKHISQRNQIPSPQA